MTDLTAKSSIFNYNPGNFKVTCDMKRVYKENGYVIIRNLLSKEELSKVRSTVENSEVIQKYTSGRTDDQGKQVGMCVWNHPGDDVLGMLVRMKRFAGTMELLMDVGEVYHYHTKITMKDAETGGSFLWHQDYGYWYYNGCLLPEMGSVFLPIDNCYERNGCLQVLRGSHRMGRIDHQRVKDQQLADKERVELAKKQFELVKVEMEAGDALFFDCNLLHTSGQNLSNEKRRVFITAFNSRNNNPMKEHHHAMYTPLHQVEDSTLMTCTKTEQDEKKKWFMQYLVEESDDTYKRK